MPGHSGHSEPLSPVGVLLLSTMVASRQPLGRKESLIEIVARRLEILLVEVVVVLVLVVQHDRVHGA